MDGITNSHESRLAELRQSINENAKKQVKEECNTGILFLIVFIFSALSYVNSEWHPDKGSFFLWGIIADGLFVVALIGNHYRKRMALADNVAQQYHAAKRMIHTRKWVSIITVLCGLLLLFFSEDNIWSIAFACVLFGGLIAWMWFHPEHGIKKDFYSDFEELEQYVLDENEKQK